jgi:hypothetical protein
MQRSLVVLGQQSSLYLMVGVAKGLTTLGGVTGFFLPFVGRLTAMRVPPQDEMPAPRQVGQAPSPHPAGSSSSSSSSAEATDVRVSSTESIAYLSTLGSLHKRVAPMHAACTLCSRGRVVGVDGDGRRCGEHGGRLHDNWRLASVALT